MLPTIVKTKEDVEKKTSLDIRGNGSRALRGT